MTVRVEIENDTTARAQRVALEIELDHKRARSTHERTSLCSRNGTFQRGESKGSRRFDPTCAAELRRARVVLVARQFA